MTGDGGPIGAGGVVLGLSFDFHDAAAAILVDGRIVAAVEEERCSRTKHDAKLPEAATRACLDIARLRAKDIDHVVFYEKPLAVASRFLAAKQRQGPTALASFVRDAPRVFGANLLVGYRVAKMLERLGVVYPPPCQFVEHHLSHAGSAFLPSPFERAAVLTVDGIGEWATATISHGVGSELIQLEELRYPDSLGLMYSFVTSYCGFRPNDDEYKVMGLAPYGTPRFVDELREIMVSCGDGSLRVDAPGLRWFGARGLRQPSLARAFDGPPRARGAELTEREADLAASIQRVTETTLLEMANRAGELTGERDLALAGGVALNCVANGRILREGPFERIWVQPAAGDAGGAIGAALALWHLELGHGRTVDDEHDTMSGAFLGSEPSPDEISAALDADGVTYRTLPDDELVDLVARHLADGEIIGWFRGRMEFGPRALGHRSILADPRSPHVRQRLNAITKGREEFRPFAPAVLADRAGEWFDLEGESPYMLIVAPVRADRLVTVANEPDGLEARSAIPRSVIPACTHVDGSARVQTVAPASNPELHRLLSAFDAITGCPVLVNTSFNRAGEPIVATPGQALATARAASMDLLVIGNCIVEGRDLLAASR